MSPTTRAKATQEHQQQKKQPKKSHSSRSSGSKPKRTVNKNSNAARPAPAPTTQAVPRKEYRICGKTAEERADRNARDARLLAAVSGVVIPSKVPAGQLPKQGRWEEDERTIYPCSICGRMFARKNHVQVHMSACVNRNGNPNGARWDDAWRNRAIQEGIVDMQPNAQDGYMEITSSEENQTKDDQTEDEEAYEYQPEDYELPDPPFGDPQRDYPPSQSPFHNGPQPASPFSASLQRYDPALSMLHSRSTSATYSYPQSASPPSTGLMPYDPDLRTDVLTNEALLAMVQAWQDVVLLAGNHYVMAHPHFQSIMHELWMRGLVDGNSNWIVNLGKVNVFFRRVVV